MDLQGNTLMAVVEGSEAFALPVAVGATHDGEKDVGKAGEAGEPDGDQQGNDDGDDADGGHGGVLDHGAVGEEELCGVEFERVPLAMGVPVQRGEEEIDGGKPKAIEEHEFAHLVWSAEDLGVAADPSGGEDGEEELEGVDEEEDDKEERGVDGNGAKIVQTVATEELVVGVPDEDEENEADGEGDEAAERVVQLLEGVRHFERDDQERHGEAKDDVREAIHTGHGSAAQAEAVFCDVIF
jgi:hypothetical protein